MKISLIGYGKMGCVVRQEPSAAILRLQNRQIHPRCKSRRRLAEEVEKFSDISYRILLSSELPPDCIGACP